MSRIGTNFDFFKTVMPDSRKADFYLGCLEGSVFMDFNESSDGLITLCRISFDGHGCCNLPEATNFLDFQMSKSFLEEIAKDQLNQNRITPLIIEIIKINQEFIWTDALQEYNLIDGV